MDRTSVGEIVANAAARLSRAGIDSPRLDARLLLAHALRVSSNHLLAATDIDAEQLETFEMLLARRAAREPLAYVTGVKEFFSLDFEVGPGVLIPRPETETLVEEAMREFAHHDSPLDVLDIGTGSGCLIIAFLKYYPSARGVGVDVSADAIAWAQRNVDRHGLSGRCNLVSGDLNAEGPFDVVFTNPPYLTDDEFAGAAPEIGRYEPKVALVAGCDGLASYRALAPELACVLKPSGLAFVEVGAGQAHVVAGILGENGLELHRIAPDLAGIPRCVIAGRRSRNRWDSQKTVGKVPATR